MGVTIHYRGILGSQDQLPKLIATMKAACRRFNWPLVEIDERVVGFVELLRTEPDPDDEFTSWAITDREPLDDRWKGLAIYPPACETLYLTINRSGRLVVYHSNFDYAPGTYWLEESISCKTQFSSPEIHISICGLLHQAEPYMADWEVHDEGNYYQNGNREALERLFAEMGKIIERLASEVGREELENLVGREISGKIEIGQTITETPPLWRERWGESANEN